MNIPSAKRLAHRGQERAAERAAGTGRSRLGFSSRSAAEAQIPNQGRLPVKRGTQALQNPDGTFVAVPGYNV